MVFENVQYKSRTGDRFANQERFISGIRRFLITNSSDRGYFSGYFPGEFRSDENLGFYESSQDIFLHRFLRPQKKIASVKVHGNPGGYSWVEFEVYDAKRLPEKDLKRITIDCIEDEILTRAQEIRAQQRRGVRTSAMISPSFSQRTDQRR